MATFLICLQTLTFSSTLALRKELLARAILTIFEFALLSALSTWQRQGDLIGVTSLQ
jgi:hypothetical protein